MITGMPGNEPAPMEREAQRTRVLRRLGLPEDGRLRLNDAIIPAILRSYRGVITNETPDWLMIGFPSLSDAVSWAEAITDTGRDRELVTLSTQPQNPYQPVTILVRRPGLNLRPAGSY